MRNAWLIARKDLKEGFGDRALMLRVALPAVILPLLYGVVTGRMIAGFEMDAEQARLFAGQMIVFAAVVAVVGTSTGGVVAAQAIVLERARRTMESLLATPATDGEIFAGKVLAALIPGVVGGYGAGILYFAAARLTAGIHPLTIPGATFFAFFVALLLPLIVAIEVAAGVMISARCGTVTGATQLAALATIPTMGAALYIAYLARQWEAWERLLFVGGLAALVVAMFYVGARALGREEIIARLD